MKVFYISTTGLCFQPHQFSDKASGLFAQRRTFEASRARIHFSESFFKNDFVKPWKLYSNGLETTVDQPLSGSAGV